MENIHPKVTISVLSYNTGKYVLEAFNCLVNQTYQNFEVIIVDDGSTDNSVELIGGWLKENNKKWEFIVNPQNKGIAFSLNTVLKKAKGIYFTGICDDLWTPEKLEHQLNILEALPDDYGMLYSDVTLFDSDTLKMYYGTQIQGPLLSVPEGNIFESILVKPIPFVSFLIKLECYKQVGLYDETLTFDDWDISIRISKKFKIKFDPKIVAMYRIRKKGLHKRMNGDIHNETCLKIYNKHWGHSATGDRIIKDKLNYWLARSLRSNPKMARPYIKDFYKRTKSNPLLYYFSILRLPGNLYYWLRITIEMIKKRKIEINYLDL